MNNSRFLNLLGMCRRAGKLSCGHDGAVGAMESQSAKLCLLSSDSSERLRNEFRREAEFENRSIPVKLISYDMYEIGHATGLKSAVLTVNDEGFAKSMLGLLETEEEGN